MKSKLLLKKFDLEPDELERLVIEAMGETGEEGLKESYEDSVKNFEMDSILPGKIVNIIGDDVVIDVGYKAEGIISMGEFDDSVEVQIGDSVDVLLESIDDESGMLILSKRRADRIRGWERVISTHAEGDVVRGIATRKIKGGLLVDIGVPVFLPASQISVRRTGDIADYIGQELECRIIKIDESRMNIVVSRRRLIEEERERQKELLLGEIAEGQVRKGVVKNIADFGAFVDLGGIDGLLHITDMSWGRISHPSEMVTIDDEIEVKILKIDRERERIALGLKQKQDSPWKSVEEKYPVSSVVKGEVVNIMSYGAFVKLEDGIEGLVHISEMSWTRRVNHPSEMLAIGDMVDVMVLDINKEKQEISLGIKQTEANPWDQVEGKYPPGTVIHGKVRNLTNYGAFVEIEEGIDGLLHVSDMSWTKKVNHPSEVLKKGDEVDAVVLSVDREKRRVALGLKQLSEDPWEEEIPNRYRIGDQVIGEVTKITNFGVFVLLENDLEGLLHISELSDDKVESPDEVVQVGDKIEVKILRVDPNERKIGLSLVRGGTGPVGGGALPEEEIAAAEASAVSRQEALEAALAAEAERTGEELADGESASAEAVATEEAPAEPVATEEASTEPVATEEAPTEAVATEEAPAEPAATEEAPAEPAATEEAPAEPVATEEAPAPAPEEASAEPKAEEPPAETPDDSEEKPADG